MHPAAGVEYQIRGRTRARVHVEPHEAMPELARLSFIDGPVEVSLSLSEENLAILAERIEDELSRIETYRHLIAGRREVVSA